MAISRYSITENIANDDRDYKKTFSERYGNKDFISMLATSEYSYPSFAEVSKFSYMTHIWSMGDRYYKLSEQYYGSSEYWWVIAFFNQKPTEFHIELGDLIRVPTPLTDVLHSYGF